MNRDLHIVGFRVGRETYGVPITTVHEIVRLAQITAVPDAPGYVEGVINLRGKVIPVLDLRKRFGEAVQPSKKNRILVVEIHGRLAGLIVDSASEVLKIPPSEVEAPPSLSPEEGVRWVTGVGKLNGRLIILLDVGRLLEPVRAETAALASGAATAGEGKQEVKAGAVPAAATKWDQSPR